MTRPPNAISSEALLAMATRLAALPLDRQRAFLTRLEEQGESPADLPVVRMSRPERVPLSFGQMRLWTVEQLNPGTGLYNMPSLFRVDGHIDRGALQRALGRVVDRHEALRTTFQPALQPGDEPEQVIVAELDVPLVLVDLAELGDDERRARMDAACREVANAPFDLAAGPLLRARLFRWSEQRHWLLVVMHHIVSDEWSGAILARELVEFYRAERRGEPARLEPLDVQYADYALWQRHWLTGKELDRQLAYWVGQLPDPEYELTLPTDHPRALASSHAGSEHEFRLDPELVKRVAALSAQWGATPFMFYLAAFQLLLGRHAGSADVRVGVPITNRSRAGTERAVGFFANTLVLRSVLESGRSVQEYVGQVRRAVLDAQTHRDVPFERVVEALRPARRVGHTPLFQVMFSWHQADAAALEADGASIERAPTGGNGSRFDLSLHMGDGPSGVVGQLTYRTDLFAPATITRFAEQLLWLLGEMTRDPARKLGRLAWITPRERTAAIVTWNQTTFDCPSRAVHEWIEEAARTAGERAAVVGETESLDYRELVRRAAAVAAWLESKGIGLEARVGLCLPRGVDLVVALTGISMSGAAYVPLEERQPAARLRELVADSRCELVLGGQRARDALAGTGVEVAEPAALVAMDLERRTPAPRVRPDNAIYVIYTSGSTGKPKGVVVTHGGLGNYVQGLLERLELRPDANMAWVSTVAADLGNTVLFGALCSGRTLHVLSDDRVFDPDALAEYLRTRRVDVLKIVPSHLRALLHAQNGGDVLPRHTLVLGGEAADRDLLASIERLGRCRIVNHYGPTETTVGILTHARGPADRDETLPVGRPLPNGLAYVLDADLQPVPVGVVGELYLGGAGVARGYSERPALTAERFVPNPFASDGSRMYKSGDRARYRPDGAIEFLGRGDAQVKLRGYRIELGEIEARLARLAGVSAARVVLRRGPADSDRLVAYVTGDQKDGERLRAALALELPDYMVPAHCVWLDRFPLTPNGKLDLRALPEPEVAGAARGPVEPTSPASPAERTLLEIWKDVLKSERIGVRDNFFALGGDSILALQVVARARRAGLRLTPKQLFAHQTIAEAGSVAEWVADSKTGPGAHAPARVEAVATAPHEAPTSRRLELSPVQHGFFAAGLAEPQHYNQAALLELVPGVDPERLERAVHAVTLRHAALHLRFLRQGGQWSAWQNSPSAEGTFSRVELQAGADAESVIQAHGERVQRSLDLESGPLLRVVHFSRGAEHAGWLLIVVHHLVVDGLSFRILLDELTLAHQQLAASEPIELGVQGVSWADWVAALQAHAASPVLRAELDYWRSQLAAPVAELPARDASADNTVASAQTQLVEWSAPRTERLLTRTSRAYRTQVNDLLVTALALTLCEWARSSSVLVEAEGHGRSELFSELDTSRTVGWFTSLYPLRLQPVANDLGASIKAVKEQLRAVPHGGIGYGLLRHLSPWSSELEGGARPRVTFNYLGQFDAVFGSDGPFRPSELRVGPARAASTPRRSWLDLQISVVAGRLRLSLEYSSGLHSAETAQALLDAYQRTLERIVEHCTELAAGAATPSDFPLLAASQSALDRLPLDFAQVADMYPLTPMQRGLMMHSLIARGSGVYHMQNVFRIQRPIDETAFVRAWQAVARRHAVLRTAFLSSEELGDVQVVYAEPGPICELIDHRHLSAEQQTAELRRLLDDELRRGFDLSQPDLFRIRVIRVAERTRICINSYHHVLMDAWCRSLVLKDFFTYYRAFEAGQAFELPAAPSFRSYVEWLSRRDLEEAREFWARELDGVERRTPLAFLAADDDDDWVVEKVLDCQTWLSEEQTARLGELAREVGVTPNTVVQAAWALVLARHAGTDDVLFGVTVAGRPADLAGVESIVGLFIQTLPLRVRVPKEHAVGEWLRDLFTRNARIRNYEYLPLSEIRRASRIARGSLFHSLFVFENAPTDETVSRDGVLFEAQGVSDRTHTNYPVTVVLYPGRRLGLHLSCSEDLCSRPEVEVLLGQFRSALERLLEGSTRRVAEIDIMAPAERERIDAVQRWVTPEPFVSYVERFERCAAMWPERVVARSRAERWTYRELDRRSARCAHALAAAGVAPDDIVAVLSERDLRWLGSCLGVLRAGAAFLPLDPRQPAARALEILELSRPRVVLATRAIGQVLERELEALHARFEFLFWEDLQDGPSSAPHRATGPNHLAYVIYTSGSTGKPKGVMVEQAGMLNNQLSKLPYLGLDDKDVIAQTASQSFDISVWQLLTAPLCGAVVDIIPDEIAHHPRRLMQHVAAQGITVWQAVPSLLSSLLDQPLAGETAEPLPAESELGLRWLLATGEALGMELAKRWHARYPSIPIVNAYGPAECSDDVSLHTLRGGAGPRTGQVPIGVPVPGTQLYVLGSKLKPEPMGVAGELYSAGVGVARGYLGDARATADRFIPNPFSSNGERMYRTGDLARHLPDGSLEFIGRTDHQVKLRGFRIELLDIEQRLVEQAEVASAAVAMQRGTFGDRLVAYVVARRGAPGVGTADARTEGAPGEGAPGEAAPGEAASGEALAMPEEMKERLKTALQSVLPEYMVPSQYVLLGRLPLSANGKLDRQALPKPSESTTPERYVAPRSDTERLVVDTWSQALGGARIGIDDNFFERGGHSLLIVGIVDALGRRLRRSLPLALHFQHQTPRQLARAIDEGSQARLVTLVSLEASGTSAPLFCLHHGGGHLLGYQTLARALAGVCPVYGLQARSFYREDWVDESLDSAAEHYADEVQRASGGAPLRLLGWSLGGILALEVARRIERRGLPVQFLGLVDPGSFQFRPVDPALLDHPEHEGSLRAWIRRSHLRGKWSRLLEVAGKSAHDWLLCEFVQRQIAQQSLTEAEERELFSAVNWHVVMLKHVLEPPSATAHVWWAGQASAAERQANERLSKRLRLASSSVVPGDHASIIESPRLHAAIAAALG